MVVRCLKNELDNSPVLVLPTQEDREIGDEDFVYSKEDYIYAKKFHEYALTIDKEYVVYGILQYDGQLRYLVEDDFEEVFFFSSELFDICDASVPFEWTVAKFDLKLEKGTLFVLGYDALTNSYADLLDLLDMKYSAIKKFFDYKAWIRKWK